MLSQAVSDTDHFSFPADRDFWHNFVTQVRMYPGAMDPPHFHVDASHTDESVLVNQEFMRRFVAGWQQANPHKVTINTPGGQATFHGSDEFWNGFVLMAGQRGRARAARGEAGMEDTTVHSSLYPGQPPVRTTEADWNDYVQQWDKDASNAANQQPPPPQPQPQPTYQPAPASMAPAPAPMVSAPPQPDPMLPHLNQQLDSMRAGNAQQHQQLEALRRQNEDLQRQLQQMNQNAQMSNGELSEQLRRCQGEANRAFDEANHLKVPHRFTFNFFLFLFSSLFNNDDP